MRLAAEAGRDHITMSFEEHFMRLTGHRPFSWQARLYRRLRDADLPEAVDIPTGLGKTSVMALWLIALARRANLPRRLVYVVDRRAVVDQATRFAEHLRSNIADDLAETLDIGRGSGRLPISTLRGGFADNREWLEDPSRPAVVVGTIDMVGSRLLFEGYGVSRRMRPYHAGLLGVDTLVLLDEAHLCPPFEALLRQVAKQRDAKLGPASSLEVWTPPFRLMSLSATGREQPALPPGCVFTLDPEDYEEDEVRKRLRAPKRLCVTELKNRTSLVSHLADCAVHLGFGGHPARIVVYCDRRRDAVKVKSRIDAECERRRSRGELPWTGQESQLLVGERRIYERKGLEKWLADRGFLGGPSDPPEAPIFLVATSAGEVGVDLNADHMLCDLVSWERMVQRLGRVNRRGESSAVVDVFSVRPNVNDRAATANNERTARALDTLAAHLAPLSSLPLGVDGRRDASPAALACLREEHQEVVEAATTDAPLHPELTRPLLDAWSMTSVSRHEGRPAVAPWLRGWDKDEPRTSVVWRKHLPCVRAGSETSTSPKLVTEFFRAAPIHATEKLEAKSVNVMDWLLKRATRLAARSQDHDLAVDDAEIVVVLVDRASEHVAATKLRELRRLALPAKSLSIRERAQRQRRKKEWTTRLLPGATLVVDSRFCGLRDGLLDPHCESETASADAAEEWRKEVTDPAADTGRRMIGFRVEEVTANEDGEGLAASHFEGWRHVHTFETRFASSGAIRGGLAVFRSLYEPTTEDSRSVASVPQALCDHADQVETRARKLARNLKLSDEEVEAIAIAARFHDCGKATERWQDAMNAPQRGRPYAKTAGGGNLRLLEGYRHEFGSLLRAEGQDLPAGVRDLVLHLIAAHHGRARPLLRHDGCQDGPPSLLESKAGEVALRFARLQALFGPWGLAWREAILRAADQCASRSVRHFKRSDGDG